MIQPDLIDGKEELMFDLDKIIIYKAVIHTLNREEDFARCASYEIDHEEELTYGLLNLYLEKIMNSNQMKWATFGENKELQQVLEELDKEPSIFLEVTRDFAQVMHKQINKYMQYLPSCDIAFVLFEMLDVMYFGAIKLNHKDLYVRHTEVSPGGELNMIKRSNDLYLSPKGNVEEGFIVHLKYMDIALLDKEYKVEGDKVGFLGDLVLQLEKELSEKEKLKSFNLINKRLQEKFIGEDLGKRAQIKKAISDTLVETGKLDVQAALNKAFEEEEEIKSIYKEALGRARIDKEKIEVADNISRKKFDIQKITTSSGIEISIPVEFYEDESKLEIISNTDGTITFIIKNVDEFTSN